MCGIVGILGKGPVASNVADALHRLEYRGYDSAGIAKLEKGRLDGCRAEDKRHNLEMNMPVVIIAPLTASSRKPSPPWKRSRSLASASFW